MHIAFRKGKKNFVKFHLQKKSINIWLNAKWGEISDTKGIASNAPAKGHNGYGDYEIDMSSGYQLDYVLDFIKEAVS